ncbi:hypothetical protein [Sphingomonas bacterium]|uniref:hypothetical protein n=1 Tax=Sphingomonas bacterium TaxID=1895847 RepID=UPI001575F622|nr:hypothetical protein [Sphingomonas bacterium]
MSVSWVMMLVSVGRGTSAAPTSHSPVIGSPGALASDSLARLQHQRYRSGGRASRLEYTGSGTTRSIGRSAQCWTGPRAGSAKEKR